MSDLFEDMTAGEILDWMKNGDGWSRDCFTDEIFPVLRKKVADLEGESLEEVADPWSCKYCGWEGKEEECIAAECGTSRCPDCLKFITLGEEDG